MSETKHTPGPLPDGWSLKGDWLKSEDGYERYVKDDSGKLARHRIALILENHGYADYARRWFFSPIEAAAPEMYQALKELVKCHACGGLVEPDEEVLNEARAALAKAEGK
jgi:hypothetical protein